MTIRIATDERGIARCSWCTSDPLYIRYHDREWGFPSTDDIRLFEKICLEGFQSGLSWLTILRKRENFREAFQGFDFQRIAKQMGKRDVTRLLKDAGIVRHRGKIESTINNARRAVELADEHGSLAGYLWRFAPPHDDGGKRQRAMTLKELMQPTSPESIALSKDLRKRGWSFVGPTTMHAFMQAVGMFNHHLGGCHVREKAAAARARLRLPS